MLVVQIFAVAVELPKKYMLRHWHSILVLLLPVMTFGWLISSVFIWKLVPTISWLEALVVSACITATDPVLASAVVGKGKFARRVPGHLRNLLSAESGCNDGMAFPFAYLALLCIKHAGNSRHIAFRFIVVTVLYECLLGTLLGAFIGYAGRHAIKFAESKNLIDRESFLVFYFVLAFFCTGVGTIIGTDDLLVAFAAGAAFSWDGWFARKTEESHVSNVIDLLLNMAFFVYFGAIIPWNLYNAPDIGLLPWKLVLIAVLLILFRRIPIMLALRPIIPDIRTWREALFCGHFGPIGVGALFMSILARAELEHDGPTTPLADLPDKSKPNHMLIATIWPIVTFLIIASIIVHGSSIAVFTLGKRLNIMTLTMTSQTANTNGGQSINGQSWLSRLSRMESCRTPSILTRCKSPRKSPATIFSKPRIRQFSMRRRRGPRGANRRKDYTPVNVPPHLNSSQQSINKIRDIINQTLFSPVNQTPQQYPELRQSSALTFAEEIHPNRRSNHINSETDTDNVNDIDTGLETDCISSLSDGQRCTVTPSGQHLAQKGGQRLVAYQLDDHIIVENAEGEVLRRYRVSSRQYQASKMTSFISRTLAFLGLRSSLDTDGGFGSSSGFGSGGDVGADTGVSNDIEKQHNDINSQVESEIITLHTPIKHEDADKIDDERMKKQLKKYLQIGTSGDGSVSSKEVKKRRMEVKKEAKATNLRRSRITGRQTRRRPSRQRASPIPPQMDSTYESDDDDYETDNRGDADIDSSNNNDTSIFMMSSIEDDPRGVQDNNNHNTNVNVDVADTVFPVDDTDTETEFEKERRLAAVGSNESVDNAQFLAERARVLEAAQDAGARGGSQTI